MCGIRGTYGGGASATECDVWELVGGKGYSGGQDKDWMAHLKEDMSVFETKFERWRKAAQKPADGFDE